MKIPLRERRRQQTASDIQRATLTLARQDGFDHVTTEAIAELAGISPRTFFNYFPNKEAAAIGQTPGFPEEAKAAFVAGQGALKDDLRVVLRAHLDLMEQRLDLIHAVGELWHENNRVRWLLEQAIEDLSRELADCLALRQPGMPPALRLGLADWTMRCSGLAIRLWARGAAPDLRAALDIVWAEQLDVARLLTA